MFWKNCSNYATTNFTRYNLPEVRQEHLYTWHLSYLASAKNLPLLESHREALLSDSYYSEEDLDEAFRQKQGKRSSSSARLNERSRSCVVPKESPHTEVCRLLKGVTYVSLPDSRLVAVLVFGNQFSSYLATQGRYILWRVLGEALHAHQHGAQQITFSKSRQSICSQLIHFGSSVV